VAASKSTDRTIIVVVVVLLGAWAFLKAFPLLLQKLNSGGGSGGGGGSIGGGGGDDFYAPYPTQPSNPLANLAAKLGFGGGGSGQGAGQGSGPGSGSGAIYATPGSLSPAQVDAMYSPEENLGFFKTAGDDLEDAILGTDDEESDDVGDFSIPTLPNQSYGQSTLFGFNGSETGEGSGYIDTGAAEGTDGGGDIGGDDGGADSGGDDDGGGGGEEEDDGGGDDDGD
jgi:hypothetical protein